LRGFRGLPLFGKHRHHGTLFVAEGQAIHSEPLMYVIRPVAADDLAGLLWLAESAGIGLTTLPPSEKALAEKITASA